jgi:hypothetical protein
MSRRTWIAVSTVGALTLAAAMTVHLLSAPTYSFAAAPLAGDPACARVGERYPDRLAGLERSATTTEGAAVWGDGAVVARCGFPRLGATDDACTQVDEVLVTYGREPSVEVQLTVGEAAPDAVLVGLSPVVKHLEQDNECLAPSDVTAPTTPPHHTH